MMDISNLVLQLEKVETGHLSSVSKSIDHCIFQSYVQNMRVAPYEYRGVLEQAIQLYSMALSCAGLGGGVISHYATNGLDGL